MIFFNHDNVVPPTSSDDEAPVTLTPVSTKHFKRRRLLSNVAATSSTVTTTTTTNAATSMSSPTIATTTNNSAAIPPAAAAPIPSTAAITTTTTSRPRGRRGGRARGRGSSARGRGTRARGRARDVTGTTLPTHCSHNDLRWSEVQEGFTPSKSTDFNFSEQTGLRDHNLRANLKEPVDFMSLFLTDSLVDMVVTETNRFAEQARVANPNASEHSFQNQWTPVDRIEMKKFLGLTFLMGLNKKPQIRDSWSTDPLFYSPVFGAVMTRNRYQSILHFLHFNDNANLPQANDQNRDRLYKPRPLLTYLEEKFQEIYVVDQAISIDESLVLWKGRLYFRQYLPLKRARFGIKLYALCESKTGYMFRFRVYTGKEDPASALSNVVPNDAKEFLSSEKLVIALMQPMLNRGYHCYTDNYYTSVRLANYLIEKSTHLCGTIRANRTPAIVKDSK